MALRALLLATEKGAADVRGTLEVLLNGKPAERITLTPENNDLLHQFVYKVGDTKEAPSVEIRFAGKGGLAYQVVGRYFVPWGEKPAGEPLSIGVTYDRTRLAQDDIANATATVKNNLNKAANTNAARLSSRVRKNKGARDLRYPFKSQTGSAIMTDLAPGSSSLNIVKY